MRCFSHHEVEAVGVCVACGRGACPSCAAEVEGALACRSRCEGKAADLQHLRSRDLESDLRRARDAADAFQVESRARSQEVMRIAARQLHIQAGAAFVLAACVTPFVFYVPQSVKPFVLAAVLGFLLVGWLRLRTARRYTALAKSPVPTAAAGAATPAPPAPP